MLNKKLIWRTAGFIVTLIFGVGTFQNCANSINPYSSSNLASTTGAITCTGTYTMIASGVTGTLVISTEDSLGDIAGTATFNSVIGSISGTCSEQNGFNSIYFTRTYPNQYQTFTGTLTPFGGNPSSWQMTGNYQTCNNGGSCDSGTTTWSAHP